MIRSFIVIVALIILIYARPVISNAQTTGPTPTPVDYTLPYPGLLPDSPIYFLKVLRDKILAFFISNPVDLSTFDIQESDKRIEASYMLVTQENKTAMAESTFSKGENYFAAALSSAEQAKAQGINVQANVNQLVLSNQKHIEVLRDIEDGLPHNQRYLFSSEAKRLAEFSKQAKRLQVEK